VAVDVGSNRLLQTEVGNLYVAVFLLIDEEGAGGRQGLGGEGGVFGAGRQDERQGEWEKVKVLSHKRMGLGHADGRDTVEHSPENRGVNGCPGFQRNASKGMKSDLKKG
jgi:hypothetical protein